MRRKILCNCRWIPVKNQTVSLSLRTRICQLRAGHLQSYFSENCAQQGLSKWPMLSSEASTLQGRSLIPFVASTASSRMLKLAISRKSLIRTYCRYWGAWIEIAFALGKQSPCPDLPFGSNHSLAHAKSVQTQVVVTARQNYETSTWVSCHARGSIGTGSFFWRVLYLLWTPNLSCFCPQIRKCLPPRIWYSTMAKHRRYCCHRTSFWFVYLVKTIGDSSFWTLTKSLAVPVVGSFQPSLFSNQLGAATMRPCR